MDPSYPHLTGPAGGYVFIVTYGRSGSTLLQNLLNSLPGYCIRGENAFTLLHLTRAVEAIESADPMRGMRRAGQPSEPTHPWYGAENVDPDAYGRALADAFVGAVLKPPPGTRVAGFKEIRYHIRRPAFGPHLNFIHRVFPKARFIFNTRDPEATARSGWWASQDPSHVKGVLTQTDAMYAGYLKRHPDRGIHLHYDDYVGKPEALRPLFDFLGEPYDGDLVAQVMERRLTHLQKDAPR